MERITKYIKDTIEEMKHVKWPTSAQAVSYTILVVIISIIVALMLSGFDYLFTNILETVI